MKLLVAHPAILAMVMILALVAVVVEWSRARKRYERQGLLVEQEAVERAESQAPSELSELFTDVYAERPWHLREQEEQALRDRGRKRGAPNE